MSSPEEHMNARQIDASTKRNLSAAPLTIALQAVDALGAEPCTWSMNMLEDIAVGLLERPVIRQRAVGTIQRLLLDAIERGYADASRQTVQHGCRMVRQVVYGRSTNEVLALRILLELGRHLEAALAMGFLAASPSEGGLL